MCGHEKTAHFDFFFCPFQDFLGLQPKLKDFPGPGIFFCQFQDFPGFSRTVTTLFLLRVSSNLSTAL